MNKNLGFVPRSTTIWQRISVNVPLSCISEVSSVTDMAECSVLTENFPGYKNGNRVYVYYTMSLLLIKFLALQSTFLRL